MFPPTLRLITLYLVSTACDSAPPDEGIVRASTIIALAEQIPYRTMPLVEAAANGTDQIDTGRSR